MLIRQQFKPDPETVDSFKAAAFDKYNAGFELIASRHYGVSVELLGLAVEMFLKSIYFRFIGFTANQTIQMRDLSDAKNEAKNLGVTDWDQDDKFHYPVFWSELIIAKRQQNNRRLPVNIEHELRLRIQRIADNWFIGLRYRSALGISYSDVEPLFDDVSWLVNNHDLLWS